jgi:GNAT superfamily N-acetyltransferase
VLGQFNPSFKWGQMAFTHINLSDVGVGLIYKSLCASYKGWADFSIWESSWKQFDKDVHDFPDGIGSSGFGTLLGMNMVGFISWDPRQYPFHVIIGHNCVLPKYRNQGIGKHQITCALNNFQKDGFQYAKVSTKRDRFFTHARQMYESCGFVECAPYRNDGENMIYYSIELTAALRATEKSQKKPPTERIRRKQ